MNSWAVNVLIIISCIYFQDTDKLGKCSTYIDILLQHIRVTSVLLQTWDKFFPALPSYVNHMTFHFFVYCFYVQSTISGKRYVQFSVFSPHPRTCSRCVRFLFYEWPHMIYLCYKTEQYIYWYEQPFKLLVCIKGINLMS